MYWKILEKIKDWYSTLTLLIGPLIFSFLYNVWHYPLTPASLIPSDGSRKFVQTGHILNVTINKQWDTIKLIPLYMESFTMKRIYIHRSSLWVVVISDITLHSDIAEVRFWWIFFCVYFCTLLRLLLGHFRGGEGVVMMDVYGVWVLYVYRWMEWKQIRTYFNHAAPSMLCAWGKRAHGLWHFCIRTTKNCIFRWKLIWIR